MKKACIILCLLLIACSGSRVVGAAPAAEPQPADIAVVLLGSLEFQRKEYYELATQTLQHRFPPGPYNLICGPFAQRVFDRYSDKKGLLPGTVPADKELVDFAWTQSFDRVLYLIFTPPVVKADEVTIQWENAHASLQLRAVMVDSRRKKKTADVSTTQSSFGLARETAKHDVFQKSLEEIRNRL